MYNQLFGDAIFLTTTFKVLVAIFVGSIVGLEREVTNRPAGLRTHILVCVGACLVMDINILMMTQYPMSSIDPTRMGAQVISGMGFLGAGTIIKEGATVKGLTTAATLWTIACIGLIIGSGYYLIALIGTLLIFLALKIFSRVEHYYITKKREHCLKITTTTDKSSLGHITYILSSNNCRIGKLNIENLVDNYCVNIRYYLPKSVENEDLIVQLHEIDNIIKIESR